ncbi:hypothetical protein Tco_1370816 [Tanacetum coccineum]
MSSKTHWVRAIEIPGWTPDLNDQNNEKSNSEDEECEEVFKKDFGESDEEVQGEMMLVGYLIQRLRSEESKIPKDGVVSSEQMNDVENVVLDNQRRIIVVVKSGLESEGSRKGGSILMLMDELVKELGLVWSNGKLLLIISGVARKMLSRKKSLWDMSVIGYLERVL